MAQRVRLKRDVMSELTRNTPISHLASNAGVNVATVKNATDGDVIWLKTAKAIARALAVDVDEIISKWIDESKRRPADAGGRDPRRLNMAQPIGRFVARREELDGLVKHVQTAAKEHSLATVAITGIAGVGKTTLARKLCRDERITHLFPGGVLWVALGETPDVVKELNKLLRQLTGEGSNFEDHELDLAKAALQDAYTASQRYLMVVDDVWHSADLRLFLSAAPKGACVFTTQKPEIAHALADDRVVSVGQMSEVESFELLAPTGTPKVSKNAISSLAKRLAHWALPLELAHGRMQTLIHYEHRDAMEAVNEINRALDERDFESLNLTGSDEHNAAISATLRLVIGQLDKADRSRLIELALFPEDTQIRVTTLSVFWELPERETKDLVARLAASLLIHHSTGRISIHDLIRAYLVHLLQDADRDVVGRKAFLILQRQLVTAMDRMKYSLKQCFGQFAKWPEELQGPLRNATAPRLRSFLADIYDKERMFEEAAMITEELLETLPEEESVRLGVYVNHARILEHLERYSESLATLESFRDALRRLPSELQEAYEGVYWWARYHTGIIFIRIGRYGTADFELQAVREKASRHDQKVSALHQRAVLDLALGRRKEARKKLHKCIKERGNER